MTNPVLVSLKFDLSVINKQLDHFQPKLSNKAAIKEIHTAVNNLIIEVGALHEVSPDDETKALGHAAESTKHRLTAILLELRLASANAEFRRGDHNQTTLEKLATEFKETRDLALTVRKIAPPEHQHHFFNTLLYADLKLTLTRYRQNTLAPDFYQHLSTLLNNIKTNGILIEYFDLTFAQLIIHTITIETLNLPNSNLVHILAANLDECVTQLNDTLTQYQETGITFFEKTMITRLENTISQLTEKLVAHGKEQLSNAQILGERVAENEKSNSKNARKRRAPLKLSFDKAVRSLLSEDTLLLITDALIEKQLDVIRQHEVIDNPKEEAPIFTQQKNLGALREDINTLIKAAKQQAFNLGYFIEAMRPEKTEVRKNFLVALSNANNVTDVDEKTIRLSCAIIDGDGVSGVGALRAHCSANRAELSPIVALGAIATITSSLTARPTLAELLEAKNYFNNALKIIKDILKPSQETLQATGLIRASFNQWIDCCLKQIIRDTEALETTLNARVIDIERTELRTSKPQQTTRDALAKELLNELNIISEGRNQCAAIIERVFGQNNKTPNTLTLQMTQICLDRTENLINAQRTPMTLDGLVSQKSAKKTSHKSTPPPQATAPKPSAESTPPTAQANTEKQSTTNEETPPKTPANQQITANDTAPQPKKTRRRGRGRRHNKQHENPIQPLGTDFADALKRSLFAPPNANKSTDENNNTAASTNAALI